MVLIPLLRLDNDGQTADHRTHMRQQKLARATDLGGSLPAIVFYRESTTAWELFEKSQVGSGEPDYLAGTTRGSPQTAQSKLNGPAESVTKDNTIGC